MVRIIFDYKLESVKIYANSLPSLELEGIIQETDRSIWSLLPDPSFFRPNRKKERKKERRPSSRARCRAGETGETGGEKESRERKRISRKSKLDGDENGDKSLDSGAKM